MFQNLQEVGTELKLAIWHPLLCPSSLIAPYLILSVGDEVGEHKLAYVVG
jgi:hypothetical protein